MTAVIGHNNPPSQIESSKDVADALGTWLLANPVADTGPVAAEGALHFDRARLYLADLDDERKGRVGPLNKQVTDINDEYRAPRVAVEKLRKLVGDRLDDFKAREEVKRQQEIAEIRQRAEAAEQKAREDERREREAAEDARLGVVVDVANVTQEADASFAEHQKVQRELARAEAQKTKFRGVTGRAIANRFDEEIVIVDARLALEAMGWSDRLVNALEKDARDYRKREGHLPDGVISQGERKF